MPRKLDFAQYRSSNVPSGTYSPSGVLTSNQTAVVDANGSATALAGNNGFLVYHNDIHMQGNSNYTLRQRIVLPAYTDATVRRSIFWFIPRGLRYGAAGGDFIAVFIDAANSGATVNVHDRVAGVTSVRLGAVAFGAGLNGTVLEHRVRLIKSESDSVMSLIRQDLINTVTNATIVQYDTAVEMRRGDFLISAYAQFGYNATASRGVTFTRRTRRL